MSVICIRRTCFGPLIIVFSSGVVTMKLSVDVIALLKGILPLVADVNQCFGPTNSLAAPGENQEATVQTHGSGSESDVIISKTDNTSVVGSSSQPTLPVVSHHIVVESDHPYKPASCSGYQVCLLISLSSVLPCTLAVLDLLHCLLTN